MHLKVHYDTNESIFCNEPFVSKQELKYNILQWNKY